MKLKIIYEDDNILAIDKSPGLIVFPERKINERTLIDYLLEDFPSLKEVGRAPRYGIVHRLDKDTSGILLAAKDEKTLKFLQNQFKERKIIKRYLALVAGKIKENQGKIETLIGRSPKDRRKQKVYLENEPGSRGKREAITYYKVIERFNNFTLLEVEPKTGRKHQIRCHLSWLHHPIAGDKLYGFKNQSSPRNLERQFLHASYLKLSDREFNSDLPEDLKEVIKTIKNDNQN